MRGSAGQGGGRAWSDAFLPAMPPPPPPCQVVEDFGLLSFHPLAIENRDSVRSLLALIDKSNGYVFAGLARPGGCGVDRSVAASTATFRGSRMARHSGANGATRGGAYDACHARHAGTVKPAARPPRPLPSSCRRAGAGAAVQRGRGRRGPQRPVAGKFVSSFVRSFFDSFVS